MCSPDCFRWLSYPTGVILVGLFLTSTPYLKDVMRALRTSTENRLVFTDVVNEKVPHTQLQSSLKDIMHDVRHNTFRYMEVLTSVQHRMRRHTIRCRDMAMMWTTQGFTVGFVNQFGSQLEFTLQTLKNRQKLQ